MESLSKDTSLQSRHAQLVHLTVFLAIELLYFVLAAICLAVHGLVIPSFAYDHHFEGSLKGGFTMLFILWQTLAMFPVTRVINYTFSTEWSSQSGNLVPEVTDRVSILTAGIMDRLYHFHTHSASSPFRLALLASFVLMAISALAPGAINVDEIHVDLPTALKIGRLTTTNQRASADTVDPNVMSTLQRAREIIRLERIENSTFGYTMELNAVVGVPPLNNGRPNATLRYPSDVVHFRHSCTWEAPILNESTGTWGASGAWWAVWNNTDLGDIWSAILPLIQQPVINGSHSGFLFLGKNSSLPPCVDPVTSSRSYSHIDLKGIPSTYNASGFSYNSTAVHGRGDVNCPPTLASVLVCDPQITLYGGEVTLESNGRLTVSPSGPTSAGNIPVAAAEILFSQSLLSATSIPEAQRHSQATVNFISALLFMTDRTMNTDKYPTGVPPLQTDNINKNMDTFVGSAAKAYADGYTAGNGHSPFGNFSTMAVDARRQEQSLALVTDVLLWTAAMSLVAISATLFTVSAIRWQRKDPFNLLSIMKSTQTTFSRHPPPHTRLLLSASQSPLAVDGIPSDDHHTTVGEPLLDLPSQHTDEHDTSQTRFESVTLATPFTRAPFLSSVRQSHVFRLVAFVSFELLYIAFAAVCSSRHGLLLPEYMVTRKARVEGGFKVLSILWQMIPVSLVLDIPCHTFSSEWSYRFIQDRHLRPGFTGSVSTLTAGHIDRLAHIFKRVSSPSFRIAVLGSFVLVALSNLAPGAVHVISKSIEKPTTLHVANLTITDYNDGKGVVTNSARQRAFIITRLENIDHSSFGYSIETTSIVGWPSFDLGNSNNEYRYSSDIAHYQYSCKWEAPTLNQSDPQLPSWNAGGKSWDLWWDLSLNSTSKDVPSSGIFPLSDFETGGGNANGLSAYLFLGDNGTSSHSTINLDGLPTVPWVDIANGSKNPFEPLRTVQGSASLATVLVCDPQMNVTGGIVSLENGKVLRPMVSGLAPVGNILPTAAKILFGECLVVAVGILEGSQSDTNHINHIAASIFMADPTLDMVSNPTGIRPLDLSAINSNVDRFVRSASKAYADGYYPYKETPQNILPIGDFRNMSVSAMRQEMRVALATNAPMWITTIILVAMATISMTLLVLRAEVYEPFTLQNVLKVVQGVELQ